MKKTVIINLGITTCIVALLLALFLLTPSQTGFSTHEQIIPIPCSFHHFFKIPCPSCGLTTSLAHILNGNLLDSIKTHPLGLFFFLLFLIILYQSIKGVILSKAWWQVFQKRWLQNSIICGIGIYLIVWVIRLII